MDFDLLIAGGRLVDPASGLDAVRDVGFAGARVAAIAPALPRERAARVVEAAGCLVTPGLIDLHTHVYWGGTPLGVDAERIAARAGTTTFVDAGSAGAGNFLGFRAHVIERAAVRILAFLNISFGGIFGFSRNVMVGESGDLALLDAREAVACAADNADRVVGIKVRSGRIAGGDRGIAPVDIALEAADSARLPLMAHIDEPPPGRLEVLDRLRPGDVLTHCFRPFPNAPVDGAGAIRQDMLAARARGIVFDIGHGMGSFDFAVARAMLAGGFAPDVVSSDLHLFCADGPAYDLLVSMSKLLALGMPLADVVAAATVRPAEAIGRADLGRLAVGGVGDAAVLALDEGPVRLHDSTGAELVAQHRLVSRGIAVAGRWHDNRESDPLAGPPPALPPRATHADHLRRHLGHRMSGRD